MNRIQLIARAAMLLDQKGRYIEADVFDDYLVRVAAPGSGIGNMSFPQELVRQPMDVDQLTEIDEERQQHPRYHGEGNVQESPGAGGDEDYKTQVQQQKLTRQQQWQKSPEGQAAVRKFHTDLKRELGQEDTPDARPATMQDVNQGAKSMFDQNADGSLPVTYTAFDPQKINSTQDLENRSYEGREENRGTGDAWKLKLPQTH